MQMRCDSQNSAEMTEIGAMFTSVARQRSEAWGGIMLGKCCRNTERKYVSICDLTEENASITAHASGKREIEISNALS